jgi:probable phosphoglycerate mutase
VTKLYFVRHGKTEWNNQGRYQGANGDSPLLPESFEQIKALADYLRGISFAHAYVSPLKRARVTAQTLIKDLNEPIPLTIMPALREFNLGKMEGMTFTDVAKHFPQELHAFRHEPAAYDPRKIHGESFPQLINRAIPAIVATVAMDRTGTANLLYVSHGAALAAVIQSLLGTPLAEIRKDGGLTNSSVTILQADGPSLPFKLLNWNETSFLPEPPKPTDTI